MAQFKGKVKNLKKYVLFPLIWNWLFASVAATILPYLADIFYVDLLTNFKKCSLGHISESHFNPLREITGRKEAHW